MKSLKVFHGERNSCKFIVLISVWFIWKMWIKGICSKERRCHIYCEATHVCYIEDAREVTHVILMLFVEQG